MVSNQKPPSADYKVVKAQLQEQKFLKKLLLDRQQSMSSLLDMGHDIANHADAEEQAEIEDQLHVSCHHSMHVQSNERRSWNCFFFCPRSGW